MQAVNTTQPAQLYHLLRRQIRKPMNKPLIVFTPKGLLRHPECVNPIEDFTKGSFQEILDDPTPPKKAKTLVFCCGRVFYDLIAERRKRDVKDMAIIRIEQLYPLNEELIEKYIAKYKGFEKCFWVQEEPKNMGAWGFIKPWLRRMITGKQSPVYIGRNRSASPAAGSFALHSQQFKAFIETLFGKEKKKAKMS